MRRFLPYVVLWCLLFGAEHAVASVEIWVSPNGSDHHQGTRQSPYASPAMALRKAREMRRLADPAVAGGIRIIIQDGTYLLHEPLFVRPEDSGDAASPLVIEAAPGAKPVLSGGFRIGGWKRLNEKIPGLPLKAHGKVWVADVPPAGGRPALFRQLWVNGSKAVRARDISAPLMSRILSWNHRDESCSIPAPAAKDLANAEGLEMLIHQWWAIAILRVKDIEYQGDSARLTFHQPESRVQSEHPWPAPWISEKTGNSAFFLSNAVQFLDEPGEWFLDESHRKIYYIPHPGEDMQRATIIAPHLETLVRIEGTIDHPVSHVYFKGISFQHTGFLRPAMQGHVPHQAGMYMLDAYKLKQPGTPDKAALENQAWVGRPVAAAEAIYTSHTGFEDCRFEHLASTGLDYRKGGYSDIIRGNLFRDIGGSAILAGVFSDEAVEAHLPYNPSDQREICTGLLIADNLITNATNEDWGCVGIGAGFVRDITIEHNEVCEVSYSGISMGWGWTRTINAMRNNTIRANKIHHYGRHMYDVAGIYTLSAQPGSTIERNYIDSIYTAPYAHDPHHWFYLYTDEGSSYFTIRDNWCPSDKFLQNANGPGNVWENNGPHAPDSIRLQAGLRPQYRHLLSDRALPEQGIPVNYLSFDAGKDHPQVIELVMPAGQQPHADQAKDICRRYGIPASSVYQSRNRLIIFGHIPEPEKISSQLKHRYSGSEIKVYEAPFYIFSKKKHCPGDVPVKEWDHVVLTASLVSDTVLQQEYLSYHSRQFTDWPEVAKGFCHAQFQQLLVFRNGRQLMLVISFPKGKSLDELNPLTTENNPRVDQWNTLMKKYQEGVEGAGPGEVWTEFKPTTAHSP